MTDPVSNSEPMRFQPSARLQKYLGRELISDPNLAVIEFVKNSYDAGASHVEVQFHLAKGINELRIGDDGVGMDEAAFRHHWLRPGYSEKSPDFVGEPFGVKRRTAAQKRRALRPPAGEKGLGRLAAGRLGDRLQVWTRPTVSDPWLHVDIEWSRFDDMTKPMDAIAIPFGFVDEPDVSHPKAGTVVLISDLRQSWLGRVPGRPSPGRRRTRLGRLKQDLEFLVRPMSDAEPDFIIELISDAVTSPEDVGVITPRRAADAADYRYDFALTFNGWDEIVVSRELSRSPASAEESGKPRREDLGEVVVTPRLARESSRSTTLKCGPFTGTFVYTPPPAAKRAREIDAVGSGVLLYRDGILVEPYGLPGDDWVGVEARKASRQGHAAIQPATFSGAVTITRADNPELEDMSNRLGLLDNEASEDFFGHVQAEFANFEQIIYSEVVQPRWKSQEAKASEAAARAGGLAAVRLRAVAHSVGQPVQALGFEVIRLEQILRRSDLPADVAAQLRNIVESMEAHLKRLSGSVTKFTDAPLPEFARVPIRDLIAEALSDVSSLAALRAVEILVQDMVDESVTVPRELIVDALAEILMNAIEVDRPQGREPVVEVAAKSSSEGGSAIQIRIRDNGTGFANASAGDSLTTIESTKGRPSEGLTVVENSVVVSHGRVMIESTGPDGTVMLIVVPKGPTPV